MEKMLRVFLDTLGVVETFDAKTTTFTYPGEYKPGMRMAVSMTVDGECIVIELADYDKIVAFASFGLRGLVGPERVNLLQQAVDTFRRYAVRCDTDMELMSLLSTGRQNNFS